jgi:hypothetical protein
MPRQHRFEGLDEAFHVYEGKLTVMQPLTFVHDAEDAMVEVAVRYQACSDALGCLMPQTVTLQLPVQVQDHIDRPRQK